MDGFEQVNMSLTLDNVVQEIKDEVNKTEEGYPDRMLHQILLTNENTMCVQVDHLVSIWEIIEQDSKQVWACIALGCTWSPESIMIESEEGVTLIDVRAIEKTEDNEKTFLEGIENFHYLIELYGEDFTIEHSDITKDELIPKMVECRNLLYEKQQSIVH